MKDQNNLKNSTQKAKQKKRSPAYQRRLEKNARAENQKQMNTEEVISSQETERGSSDVVCEEATAAIRTFNCELCSFYSNIEKELSVHLASKHTKYSEIEADESYRYHL